MSFIQYPVPLWATLIFGILCFAVGYISHAVIVKKSSDAHSVAQAFIFMLIVSAWSMKTFASPFYTQILPPDIWLNGLFCLVCGFTFNDFKKQTWDKATNLITSINNGKNK